MTILLILIGKIIAFISRLLNKGDGSTWPGEIALRLDKHFVKKLLKNSHIKIILIAGTNGKTTTGKMLATILSKSGKRVFQNTSGANLLNGLASSLLLHTKNGKLLYDFAIFEVDENTLPLVLQEVNPFAVVFLNLFRDQLDRYGELDTIAKKWKLAIEKLQSETLVILNADDPLIVFVGKERKENTFYFGLSEKGNKNMQHAADSIYCPNCGEKLHYKAIFYSHLGDWRCMSCKFSRPKTSISKYSQYPLLGEYNKYNTLASALAAQKTGIDDNEIASGLKNIEPAFGRQEKIEVTGKKVQIFLSKNPTGFNENLETITSQNNSRHSGERSDSRIPPELKRDSGQARMTVLFVLNDRIPDGTDVSWIWDIDLESYVHKFKNVIISGDRVYDMSLRIAYSRNDKFLISNFKSNPNFQIIENLKDAIVKALELTEENETLYILPTYSAMLEVRKILTGKKIL